MSHTSTEVASDILVNFGGFVPLSTVDWRGRSVCTVFFRGCPVRCWYCQNKEIQTGTDERRADSILAMIQDAQLLISGVVFSGGEATMQRDALVYIAKESKKMGLLTGLHTNGLYPETIDLLIQNKCIDHIALDIKARWENYSNRLGLDCVTEVKRSLSLCQNAMAQGNLLEFEVVITLFRGYDDELSSIIRDVRESVSLILQQGVVPELSAFSEEELMDIADRMKRTVRIRTREGGEIVYEGNRNRRTTGKW